ncbi:hypothetical protein T01_12110, partial [Trichinella spiralis]
LYMLNPLMDCWVEPTLLYKNTCKKLELIRLMFLHCAQMIITRSCPYSYRFSSLTQSTEPAQNKALLQ